MHVGVAVAVEDGLVVPVVKFTDEQTLPQIGAAVKDYAFRARDKKLKPRRNGRKYFYYFKFRNVWDSRVHIDY